MVAVSPGTTNGAVVVAGTAQKPRNESTDWKKLALDPVCRDRGGSRMESRQDDTSTKNDTDDSMVVAVDNVVEREEVEMTTPTASSSSGADAEENTIQAKEEQRDNTANDNGEEEGMTMDMVIAEATISTAIRTKTSELSTTEKRTARMIEAATSIVASLTTREEEPTTSVTISAMEDADDNADEDDTAAAAADPDFWAATVATVIAVAAATAIMKATDTACCQSETAICTTEKGMIILPAVRTEEDETETPTQVAVPWNNNQQPYAAMADEIEEHQDDDTVHDEKHNDHTVVVSTMLSPPPPPSRTICTKEMTTTTTQTMATETAPEEEEENIDAEQPQPKEGEEGQPQMKKDEATTEGLFLLATSMLEQFETTTACDGGGCGAPAPVRETVHASCCADHHRLVLHGRATKDTITPYPTPILTVPQENKKEKENNTEKTATTSVKEHEEVLHIDKTKIPNTSNTTKSDSEVEANRTNDDGQQPLPHNVGVATRLEKNQPEEPNHPIDDTIGTQACDPAGSVVVHEETQNEEHWVVATARANWNSCHQVLVGDAVQEHTITQCQQSMTAMLDTATTAVTSCSSNATAFCSGQVPSCTELAMSCTDRTPSADVPIVVPEPVLNNLASDEVAVPKAAKAAASSADNNVIIPLNNTTINPDGALHNANDSTVDQDALVQIPDPKNGGIETKVNPSNKRSVDSSIMSESTAITLLIHYFTTLDRHFVTEGEPAKTAVIMFQGLIMPVINGRTPTTSEEGAIRKAAHEANVPTGFMDTFLDHIQERHQNGAIHKGLRPELVSKGRDDDDEVDESPVKVLLSINIEPETPLSSSLSPTLGTPQDVKATTVIHADSLICETGAVEHDQTHDQDRADKDDKLKLSLIRDDNIDDVLLKGWEPIEDTNQDDGIAVFLQKMDNEAPAAISSTKSEDEKMDNNKVAAAAAAPAISTTIADDDKIDNDTLAAISSTNSDEERLEKELPTDAVSSTKSDDKMVDNISSSKSNDDDHVSPAAIPGQEEIEKDIDEDDNKEEINSVDKLTAQPSRDDKIDDVLLKGWEPIEDTNQDVGIAVLLQKMNNEASAAAILSIKSDDEDHVSAAAATSRQEETEKENADDNKEKINNVDEDHLSAVVAVANQVEIEKENDGGSNKYVVDKLSASWSRDDDIDNALLKGWEPIENTNQDDDIAALLQKMDHIKARTAAIPFTKRDDDELASLAVEKTHQLVTEIEIDGDHKEDVTNDTDTNVDEEAPTLILSTKCDDDDHAPAVTVISRQAEIKKESDGGHKKEETNEVNNDLTSSPSRHGTIDAVLLKGWEPIEETNQDDNIAVFLQKMGHRPIHEAKRRDIAEIKDLIVRFGHGPVQDDDIAAFQQKVDNTTAAAIPSTKLDDDDRFSTEAILYQNRIEDEHKEVKAGGEHEEVTNKVDKTIVVVAVNDDRVVTNSVVDDANTAKEEREESYAITEEGTTTLATESSATETTATASTATDRDDNNCNLKCDSGVTTPSSTASTDNNDPNQSTTATTTSPPSSSSSSSSAPLDAVVDCDRPLLTRAWSFPFPMQYEDDEALDNEGKACYHHHGWDTGEETKSNVYHPQTGTRQKYPNLRFYFLP